MLQVSQKCQYGLRAVLELAARAGTGPVSVSEIAAAQAIPPRFLELILNQLRKAGFVSSYRGVQGGYELAGPPGKLTVGVIIRQIDGPMAPVDCIADGGDAGCALYGHCAFMGMWRRAQRAVEVVYDGTTFQNLLDQQRAAQEFVVANYTI